MVYHDLNVSLPSSLFPSTPSTSYPVGSANTSSKKQKKNKQQQQQQQQQPPPPTPGSSSEGSLVAQDPLRRLSKSQRDELEGRVKDLRELGYSTIAFNHIVQSRFDHNIHHNPFPTASASSSSSSSSLLSIPLPPTQVMPSVSDPIFPSLAKGKNPIRQLHRLTLILDADSESKAGNGLIPAATPALLSYDLLAVKPLTASALNMSCLTHTELKPGVSFDIICLDLSTSARLPFFLKRSTVGKAIDNGAVFEVCYSDALPFGSQPPLSSSSSSSSSTSIPKAEDRLRNLISNTRDLLRVTNGGRGLILSSGASSVLGLRGPGDIVNLASLFGFSQTLARDALQETCRRLLIRAETRRSYRGVVGWPRIVHEDVIQPTFQSTQGTQLADPDVHARDPDPATDMDLGTTAHPTRTGTVHSSGESVVEVGLAERKRKSFVEVGGKDGKKQRQS